MATKVLVVYFPQSQARTTSAPYSPSNCKRREIWARGWPASGRRSRSFARLQPNARSTRQPTLLVENDPSGDCRALQTQQRSE